MVGDQRIFLLNLKWYFTFRKAQYTCQSYLAILIDGYVAASPCSDKYATPIHYIAGVMRALLIRFLRHRGEEKKGDIHKYDLLARPLKLVLLQTIIALLSRRFLNRHRQKRLFQVIYQRPRNAILVSTPQF